MLDRGGHAHFRNHLSTIIRQVLNVSFRLVADAPRIRGRFRATQERDVFVIVRSVPASALASVSPARPGTGEQPLERFRHLKLGPMRKRLLRRTDLC